MDGSIRIARELARIARLLVASDSIDPAFISRLCRKVNGRRGYAFGGDCGMFALGMCRFLSEHGFSGMKIVFSIENGWEDDTTAEELATEEVDVYHVSFKVGENTYDGDGLGDANLKSIALEEYGDSSPTILEFDWDDPNVRRAITANTDYGNTDTAFHDEAVRRYGEMA